MNTKQLRQTILDLAIRGELVPQDPTDEPASGSWSVFVQRKSRLSRVKAQNERRKAANRLTKSLLATSHKGYYDH